MGNDGRPRRIYRDWNPEYDSGSRERLEPEITELFAGVIAERRFRGRQHNWVGATNDLETATDLVFRVVGSEKQGQKYSDFLWAMTEDIVAREWALIEALAEELLKQKTIRGPAIREFLYDPDGPHAIPGVWAA